MSGTVSGKKGSGKKPRLFVVHGAAGVGKTRLIENLLRQFGDSSSLALIINAVGNREDADHLLRVGALPEERMVAVDVAGFSARALGNASQANTAALERLFDLKKPPQAVILEAASNESGGVFDDQLVDFNIAVLDAAAGDRVALKQAARIKAADWVVVNRCDLASQCDVSFQRIRQDIAEIRPDLSVPFLSLATGAGLDTFYALLSEHL